MSKQFRTAFEDDEVFENSAFMANFEDSFQETTHSNSALNVSALCCDEEISGYDKLTGRTWIYPTNYPVRDYQFNIIKAALLKNTLVSLPTGLGKTFIAAVVMYNFYRWYPLGKIVFTAPTRPLVAQQIEACYNIIAIPPNDTIEMTGHMQVSTRKGYWQSKRVFFATPQVIYNDIKSGICPSDKIRCLVIDEAHKARGNYAYCQIVSTLSDMGHKTYRILALSATPGSKIEDVINVVKNLHIAHLELRTENCIDVAPYSHTRKINTVIVQLGPELTHLRRQYVEILDGYARRLKQLNILPHNLGNLSKGRIVMLYKEYQNRERGARHPQHNLIMKDFTFLIALYHGLELLIKHGSRVFLNFFDEHPEKTWMQSDDRLTAMLERLRDDLGVNPLSLDRSILPDGTIPQIPKNLCFGHPKFEKLKEIVLEHFNTAKQKSQDTRAIVFCEYRESVNLVHCLLLQCRPLIMPQMFVGQGASGKDGNAVVSQKQQLRVMRSFREGASNTLVATSVAEEGLDVGSVDLIVCFDISTRSPIRLVQRCGRTGRERGGKVFILVTEGREHQTLMDCMRQKDGLNKKILQSKDVESNLYKFNPRMMPHDFTPECQKMFITVAKKNNSKESTKEGVEKSKQGQKDLRSMLFGKKSSTKEINGDHLITKEEFTNLFTDGFSSTAHLVDAKEYWSMDKDAFKATCVEAGQKQLELSTWLEWQRSLQKTVNIAHSKDTEILSTVLQYSDAKRFDVPVSTQIPTLNPQDLTTQNIRNSSPAKPKPIKKKQKLPLSKSPSKKDGDIRALFSTTTKSTKNYTKLINDLGVQNINSIPTHLINLFVDLKMDNTNTRKCYICQNVCDCILMKNIKKQKIKITSLSTFLNNPVLPNIDLIDDISTDCILKCVEKSDENQNVCKQNFDKCSKSCLDVNNKNNCSNNFDLEFDFDSIDDFNSSNKESKQENLDEKSVKNFDIGDIEDVFAESSPEEVIRKEVEKVKDEKSNEPKEKALEFFGLDSIDDIFADSDDSCENKPSETLPVTPTRPDNSDTDNIDKNCLTVECPISPSILSGRQNNNFCITTSPILGSQIRKIQLSTRKLQSQNSTSVENNIVDGPEEMEQISGSISKPSLANTTITNNKSMLTITQLVEMINKTDNASLTKSNVTKTEDNYIKVTKNCERCTSPILLTQVDRKKSLIKNSNSNKNTFSTSQSTKNESLIVLDSDSDTDNKTEIYDVRDEIEEIECNNSDFVEVSNNKRKLEMDDSAVTASPYFVKKQKLDNHSSKSLQEKVMAALTSNKSSKFNNKDNIVNSMISVHNFPSQKENENPKWFNKFTKNNSSDDEKSYTGKIDLEMLQIFRRDSKVDAEKKNLFVNAISQSNTIMSRKRKIIFDESNDDFVDVERNGYARQTTARYNNENKSITNHKVRKKNKKGSEFLELEAELTDDGEVSGDELSDDSIGSIADFICDDNVTHHEDMQAHYMKSIKSPVKGVFKIPSLPKKYEIENVFSQFVEEDDYEMDSFCVDSHVGLTQVNEISELELAELILEEKKKGKGIKKKSSSPLQDADSPVIKRKNKKNKRQIHSDSDDSN